VPVAVLLVVRVAPISAAATPPPVGTLEAVAAVALSPLADRAVLVAQDG
jgi:hypothetical protein